MAPAPTLPSAPVLEVVPGARRLQAPRLRPCAPRDTCLYDVVLAGSHDSAAYHISTHVASRAAIPPLRFRLIRWGSDAVLWDFSATQDLSVLDQLRAGVRFLDLRVTKLLPQFGDDRFWTCHGQALCLPLEDILAEINIFHDELAAQPRLAPGKNDLPVVSVWRTFNLSAKERVELGEYVACELRGGYFAGAPDDLRSTPLGELPRNIVVGLPELNDLFPANFGHDAWIDTFQASRKIAFLVDFICSTKCRSTREDLAIVGWTVTAHTTDVVLRIVSGRLLRPSLKLEALKMNALLPSFLRVHGSRLATVANVVFCDFLTDEMVAQIVELNNYNQFDSPLADGASFDTDSS